MRLYSHGHLPGKGEAQNHSHLLVLWRRPGSVIGPQQNFLGDMEKRMWREGEAHRRCTRARGLVAAPASLHLLPDLPTVPRILPTGNRLG